MMPIVVIVQVSPDEALALHEQTPPDEMKDLLALIKRQGMNLKPVHPGTHDPLLIPFFTVEVPDQSTAERIIAALCESKAVEGAYTKPAEAPP